MADRNISPTGVEQQVWKQFSKRFDKVAPGRESKKYRIATLGQNARLSITVTATNEQQTSIGGWHVYYVQLGSKNRVPRVIGPDVKMPGANTGATGPGNCFLTYVDVNDSNVYIVVLNDGNNDNSFLQDLVILVEGYWSSTERFESILDVEDV